MFTNAKQDSELENKVEASVMQLCNLIDNFHILTINTTGFRLFSAFNNAEMAGRVGRDMTDAENTQKQIKILLESIKKSLDFNQDSHRILIEKIQQELKKCDEATLSHLQDLDKDYLNKILRFQPNSIVENQPRRLQS